MVIVGIQEIAEYLHMSKATLYAWTSQKKIPHLKVGGTVKFDLHRIQEWLRGKEIKRANGK